MHKLSALRYYRKKNKLTVRELSNAVGIPIMTIKSWEKLHRSIEFMNAWKLAYFFKVQPSTFSGKKTLEISNLERHNLYRPSSIYIPHEIRVHDKYKKLIDQFLYTRRPSNRPLFDLKKN